MIAKWRKWRQREGPIPNPPEFCREMARRFRLLLPGESCGSDEPATIPPGKTRPIPVFFSTTGKRSPRAGHLAGEEKKMMVAEGNRMLDDINARFATPVCQTIGASWQQVPHRFELIAIPDESNRGPQLFRISHYNCGRHEFDFNIDAYGLGQVIAERYNGLSRSW